MKESIFTHEAPKPVGPYSQGVRFGNLIFVSGQLPLSPESGELVQDSFEAAVERALTNMIEIVKAGGGDVDTILQVRVYLKDLSLFREFNRVYSRFFGDGIAPARVVVEVSKIPLDADLMVECIAYTVD